MRELTLDQLSAYVDGELTLAEREEIERRLASSPDDRNRLAEWREMVGDLKLVGREEVPPEIYRSLARKIALERPASGLANKLEERRSKDLRFSPTVWTLLGTILAMAVILFLMADLTERRSESTSVVFLGPIGEIPIEAGGKVFFFRDNAWTEPGLEEAAGSRTVSQQSPEGLALTQAYPEVVVLLESGLDGTVPKWVRLATTAGVTTITP